MKNTATKSPLVTAAVAALFLVTALACSLFFNNMNPIFLSLSGFAFLSLMAVTIFVGRTPSFTRALIPLTLLSVFAVWIGITAALSDVGYVSLNTAFAFAALPLTSWAVISLAWTRHFSGLSLFLMGAMVVLLSIYGCYQFFWLEALPTATFINRNNFAAFQIPIVLLALVGMLNHRNRLPVRCLLGLVVVLLSFVIGLIGSRGALIALLGGLIMTFSAMIYLGWSRRAMACSALIIAAALAVANFAGTRSLGERVLSISDPVTAGSTRFSIWEGSLELAQQAPWHGVGPGMFFLTYPPYRLDSDKSTGLYVHNDYLQLWVETGWPAVVLILAAALSAFYLSLRFLTGRRGSNIDKVRAFAAISGVAAIMAHSLLTFNLYLLPILIQIGLLFGFVTVLVMRDPVLPANPKLPLLVKLLLLTALSWPAWELTRTLQGTRHFDASVEAFKTNKRQEGVEQLSAAIDWWPSVDLYHYTLAWQQIQQASKSLGGIKTELLENALGHLDIAQTLNPYRPQPHVIRATLFQSFPEYVPDGYVPGAEQPGRAAAEQEYETAMAKDPFYLEARFRLARLMLEDNRLQEGLAVLERGIGKAYDSNSLTQNYYRLTAEMRRILGDDEGYRELLEEVARVKREVEKKRLSR